MHGRLKVRTTEEERERKKKEQALKVRAYKAAMVKIQKKRELDEMDDEMLQMTVQILLRNPDIGTLWNIRRECVERKIDELQAAGDMESKDNKLNIIYATELSLTEQCLMVNPKSYNGWHHRIWTLEKNPNADWQNEMHLCNKYLKLDERNFHTWDYRRYVAAKAGVPNAQELEYCTEKIKVNFSNYSSWHHRSLLLPILFPYEGEALPKRPMNEEKLKEELEMVLTAAFTDPNDSSAWFYQRWLLGYSRAELDVCAFRCDREKAVLAFTKPVEASNIRIKLVSDTRETLLEINDWKSKCNTTADTTWLARLPTDHSLSFGPNSKNLTLELDMAELSKSALPLQTHPTSVYYFKAPNSVANYTPEVLTELKTQLESCESLLEYEPDSKWTLLTSALLMRAIDPIGYHEKSLSHLTQLEQVDSARAGYYQDLASKWLLEHLLIQWATSNDIPALLNLRDVPQLKSLHYTQYLSIADDVQLTPELTLIYKSDNELVKTFDALKL